MNNFKQYLSITLLAILVSSCSRDGPPAQVEVFERPVTYHVVREGQDIGSISRTYSMEPEELIKLNQLREPYQIYVGQRLLVSPTLNSVLSSSHTYQYGQDQQPVTVEQGEQTPSQLTSTQALPAPPAATGYIWPVRGKIIRGFSKSGPKDQQSEGLNIAAPKGTPVVATNNGVVAMTGNYVSGYGNVVVVKHQNGLMSVYAHMNEVFVKRGQKLTGGQKIGTVGNTGYVKKTQLHFQVRQGTKPIDPKRVLN